MIRSIENLVDLFKIFPGIGEKSAKRMAYFLLNGDNERIDRFISAFSHIKNIEKCKICGMYIEENKKCKFCDSQVRDHTRICIVEDFFALDAIESASIYNGLYHILGGHISPAEGIFVKDLNINSLLSRITKNIEEIIIATNPTLEGDATANYIVELLKKYDHLKITRLATGLPSGGEISILSPTTIKSSFRNRMAE
jgi:recombination protein RecR